MRGSGKLNDLYGTKAFLYHLNMLPTHLRSFQALELAVRTGSLKAAAAQLGITQAAVGQRIKALEDYLGMDLLVRGRSGIRPTNAFAASLAHVSAAFRELETAAAILDLQRIHEIHIVADTDWAELWLHPRLPAFKSANPGTLFCINGVGDVPLRLGQADCEIWFGDARGGSEENELFRDYLLPVSSPENKKRVLGTETRLEGFPLLHLDCYRADPGAIGWPDWIRTYGHRSTAPERGIRFPHIVRALESVYADAGLLLCGLALISPQLDSGRLSALFPLSQGAWTAHAYRATFKEASLRRKQVARFRSWLLAESMQTSRRMTESIAAGPKGRRKGGNSKAGRMPR
jgi:LysR family glycine cleavage system transcriptional activator